jgi:hypothetical protein
MDSTWLDGARYPLSFSGNHSRNSKFRQTQELRQRLGLSPVKYCASRQNGADPE